jgi:hypothetical protein
MKDDRDRMYDLLDGIMNAINKSNQQKGTGKNYFYKMDVEKKGDDTVYKMDINLKEAGHKERILQSLAYTKPKSLDKYAMEFQVILSLFTIFTESTLFHWDELGKRLNMDLDLQNSAKQSSIQG